MNLRMMMSSMADPDPEFEFVSEPRRESRVSTGRSPALPRTSTANASSDRIDAALAEMNEFLTLMHPSSDAEALQSLRQAFPAVPLSERINAIRTRFFA